MCYKLKGVMPYIHSMSCVAELIVDNIYTHESSHVYYVQARDYYLQNYTGEDNCTSFLRPLPTCPGDLLVFQCSTFDNSDNNAGETVWTVSNNQSPCILKHVIWPRATGECGSFQAKVPEQSTESCFRSTLTATASPLLDGVEVACNFAYGSTNSTAGRQRITVIGEQL